MTTEKLKALIGYVRVSTSQQGRSGLGLEAQKRALERFSEAEGFTLARAPTPWSDANSLQPH
jgi:DNA invertase Pin-like site-specific DNA recombinase